MIGYLNGNIISSRPTKIILECSGVGYEINISLATFDKVSQSKNVALFIHTNVKEDAIDLYGFLTETEKEFFKLLISVNGIGPKTGLAILSGLKPEDVKSAIARGNIGLLSSVPGIGKKTAERVILELKSKIDMVDASSSPNQPNDARSEAILALASLGYNQKIAEKTIFQISELNPDASIETLLKLALRKISGQ